mmetsp:Transcript_7823/g.6678  ORF Transcript_7823/g.6678 Transcript_7823/m.6678 type:complete len:164 (-) Transcript_7823:12-503(-)
MRLAAVGSSNVEAAVRDFVVNPLADAEAWVLGYAARAFGVDIVVRAPGCPAMDCTIHSSGVEDARVVTLLYTAPANEGGCGHYDVVYNSKEADAAAASDFLIPGTCSRCRSNCLLPQRLLSWPCGHWLCRKCVLRDIGDWGCDACRRTRVKWCKLLCEGKEKW